MRIPAWTAAFVALIVVSAPARAQIDVSCPTTLRPRFNHYQGVTFQGKEFETYWQNTAGGALGGPSYAWFAATPNPDPISVDGSTRWRGAQILVHCYAVIGWGGTRYYHYHPKAYTGRLEPVSIACDGGEEPLPGGGEYMMNDPTTGLVVEDGTTPLTRLVRDPDREGAPPDTYILDCSSGSGGGGGLGGGSVSCHWEYMLIEISYDGGRTWHVWWEGWGQVCEQNEA